MNGPIMYNPGNCPKCGHPMAVRFVEGYQGAWWGIIPPPGPQLIPFCPMCPSTFVANTTKPLNLGGKDQHAR